MLPLWCWGERVACGVTCASKEEWQDLDFYAMSIEERSELLDVCEAEPGVWGYLGLSVWVASMRCMMRLTAIDVDGKLASFGDAHFVSQMRRYEEAQILCLGGVV